jgi:hypothetical protein
MKLWSFARITLGLSRSEFFAATSRELFELGRVREREDEDREYMLAQLAACVVNFSLGAPEEPSKIADFRPSVMRKRLARQKPKTPEEIAAKIRRVVGAAWGDR